MDLTIRTDIAGKLGVLHRFARPSWRVVYSDAIVGFNQGLAVSDHFPVVAHFVRMDP